MSSPSDSAEIEARSTASAIDRPIGSPRAIRRASRATPTGALGLGAGAPLGGSLRSAFEPRFGFDFGGVRVHTHARAHSLASSLGADAVTYGHEIAFARGQFAPETSRGRRLLSHELTHVVQQQGGSRSAGIRAAPVGLYRGIAGNCIANLPNTRIGELMHQQIQWDMVAMHSTTGLLAEVGIPGAGVFDDVTPGYVDLYFSFPPGVVPLGPVGRMFPPAVGTFPPLPVPTAAFLGSIKPLTHPEPLAYADLADYIAAFDRVATAAGGSAIAAPMLLPTDPTWLVPGRPFPWSPAGLPQTMHVFTTGGMYWYFCRPLVEILALAWLAARARDLWRRMLDMLRRMRAGAGELGGRLVEALTGALGTAFAAAMSALSSVTEVLEEVWPYIVAAILIIAVIAVLVFFGPEIIAGLAAAGSAVVGAVGSLVTSLGAGLSSAGAGLAALLGTSEAGATGTAFATVILGMLAASPASAQSVASGTAPAPSGVEDSVRAIAEMLGAGRPATPEARRESLLELRGHLERAESELRAQSSPLAEVMPALRALVDQGIRGTTGP